MAKIKTIIKSELAGRGVYGGRGINYRDYKKRLNKYVNFSFNLPRKGKKLTPAQKATITRMWKKYGHSIRGIEKGEKVFVKATRAQKRALGRQFFGTAKGIFVNRATRAKIVGKGKNTQLLAEIRNRRSILVPRKIGENIDDFFNRMLDYEAPDDWTVALSINGSMMAGDYMNMRELLTYISKRFEKAEEMESIKGVYFIKFMLERVMLAKVYRDPATKKKPMGTVVLVKQVGRRMKSGLEKWKAYFDSETKDKAREYRIDPDDIFEGYL